MRVVIREAARFGMWLKARVLNRLTLRERKKAVVKLSMSGPNKR